MGVWVSPGPSPKSRMSTMSAEVGRMVAMVGMAVGVVVGVAITRVLQPDCHCKKCTHFETLGESPEGSACQEFACFHKFTGLPVLHNWQLRGCIILIKTRKSEMVVKYDGELEDVVTF